MALAARTVVAWVAVLAAAAAALVVADSSMFPMSVYSFISPCAHEGFVDVDSAAPIQCRLAGSEGPVPPGWYVLLFGDQLTMNLTNRSARRNCHSSRRPHGSNRSP